MPKGNHLGSRSTFLYVGDDGNTYNVVLDRSKAEAMGFAIALPGIPSRNLDKFMQMRYVNLRHPSDSNVKRTWEVPTAAQLIAIIDGSVTIASADPLSSDPTQDVTWIVTSYRGESGRIPNFAETGLDDTEVT